MPSAGVNALVTELKGRLTQQATGWLGGVGTVLRTRGPLTWQHSAGYTFWFVKKTFLKAQKEVPAK